MCLKNKIITAILCAFVAGIGIFSFGPSAVSAENSTSTAQTGSALNLGQLEELVNNLRQQIMQLVERFSDIIKNRGQLVSICNKTMPGAATESEKASCAAAGGNIVCEKTCPNGNATSTACTTKCKCDCTKKCGNGTCDAGETAANCDKDCKKTALKGEAEVCGSNAECASGFCSQYGTMCCNSGQCGWGDGANFSRECVDNGKTKDNQWLNGICVNGVWKTRSGGIGCNAWDCADGNCANNQCSGTIAETKCIIYGGKCCKGDACTPANSDCGSATSTIAIITKCDDDCKPVAVCKKTNVESCANDSECASGRCSYGTCCAAGQCGWGDGATGNPRTCVADGSIQSNQWLSGICRNGVWKTVLNGNGCSSFACDQGTCADNVCTDAKKANGVACTTNSECASNACKLDVNLFCLTSGCNHRCAAN